MQIITNNVNVAFGMRQNTKNNNPALNNPVSIRFHDHQDQSNGDRDNYNRAPPGSKRLSSNNIQYRRYLLDYSRLPRYSLKHITGENLITGNRKTTLAEHTNLSVKPSAIIQIRLVCLQDVAH